MAENIRPELGKLEQGQQVMVRRSLNDSRGRMLEDRYIPARVTKVGRVWVTLEATTHPHRGIWRMRLDTQDEGTKYSGSNASFLTMDQHAWDETRDWALATLRDHGIDLRSDSPWRGREIELADHLAKIDPHDTDGEGQ